jgi:hypothetical protein
MTRHLNQQQIIQAIVDISDLTDSQKAHLSACPRCGDSVNQLNTALARMGAMAAQSVPDAARPLVIPTKKPGLLQRLAWNWRPYFRVAVPVMVVLIIAVASVIVKSRHDKHMLALEEQDLRAAEQLMTEVNMLIDNPLSADIQTLISIVETESDEEFIQYILPTIENDPLSNMSGKKGEFIC